MNEPDKATFWEPPYSLNSAGEERRAGFEIEFAGLEIRKLSVLLQRVYGGNIHKQSAFEYQVSESRLGDFSLELDASLIKEKKYEKLLQTLGVDLDTEKRDNIEEAIKNTATPLIPFEIVTPPIALSALPELNALISEMRSNKAKGTKDSFLYAFGMHINPETPSLETGSILDHLRAYVLLDPWIRKDAGIDLSRRITPYIDPFQKEYIKKILNMNYDPDLRSFIKDYIQYENTRNRSLDLIPLLMYLDEKFVNSLVEDELSTARPTYHYRLPNCEIDDPEWSLAGEWNRWVWVERLASDKEYLEILSRKWLLQASTLGLGKKKKWITHVEKWMSNYE